MKKLIYLLCTTSFVLVATSCKKEEAVVTPTPSTCMTDKSYMIDHGFNGTAWQLDKVYHYGTNGGIVVDADSNDYPEPQIVFQYVGEQFKFIGANATVIDCTHFSNSDGVITIEILTEHECLVSVPFNEDTTYIRYLK